MKRFAMIIVIPILLFAFQALLRLIPADVNSLPEVFEYLFSGGVKLKVLAVGLIIALYLIAHLTTFGGYYKRLTQFDSIKHELLDQSVGTVIRKFEKKGIFLRANIMIIHRRLWALVPFRLPAWTRRWTEWEFFFLPLLFARCFTIEYTYNMEHDIDRKLSLSLPQGVAGVAFCNGAVLADFNVHSPDSFMLRKKQRLQTANLNFVLSLPIWGFDYDIRRQSKKIIGVLNFDSMETDWQAIESSGYANSLVEKMRDISLLARYYF